MPVIDGTPVRILAEKFGYATGTDGTSVISGGFAVTNRDNSGTIDPSSNEANAIAKFVDVSNLSAAARGSGYTRLANADVTHEVIIDLEDPTPTPDQDLSPDLDTDAEVDFTPDYGDDREVDYDDLCDTDDAGYYGTDEDYLASTGTTAAAIAMTALLFIGAGLVALVVARRRAS